MRRRLLVSYMTVTLVIVLLLAVPLGLVYAREQRRRLTALVERDAFALAIRAEEGLESNEAPGVVSLVEEYQLHAGGRVVVIRPDGSVLADSESPPGGGGNFLNRPEVRAALAREETVGSRYSKSLGHSILYVAVPIVHADNEVLGALRVTYPTSYVDERIRNGWLALVGIGLIVLLVVFVVSLRLARQVTEPIERLATAAARVGAGDLDARAPVPRGPPELRDLADQFNTTSARLERLVRSQREFVADASHQLRTPLAALRLRLENLESEVPAGSESSADVAGCLTEVGRLSRLVDGLLTLARTERVDAAPEPTNVAAVLEGRAEAWSAFAEEAEVRFTVECDPSLSVSVTPGHLEQVLDNLVANAIEVSPAGSTIGIDRACRACRGPHRGGGFRPRPHRGAARPRLRPLLARLGRRGRIGFGIGHRLGPRRGQSRDGPARGGRDRGAAGRRDVAPELAVGRRARRGAGVPDAGPGREVRERVAGEVSRPSRRRRRPTPPGGRSGPRSGRARSGNVVSGSVDRGEDLASEISSGGRARTYPPPTPRLERTSPAPLTASRICSRYGWGRFVRSAISFTDVGVSDPCSASESRARAA